MSVLLSGGCKNGKSYYAQMMAKQMQQTNKPLYYLATMIPIDREDHERIARHQQEREGWGFETIEISRNILTALEKCDIDATFLLDSVTALLVNEMFRDDGTIVFDAAEKLCHELTRIAMKWHNTVFVSDNIFSDAQIYDAVTEHYRKGLAAIDRALAKVCDPVLEVTNGMIIEYVCQRR